MKNKELKEYDVNLLIICYLTDSINENEIALLNQWINTSEENRYYFNLYKDAWILSADRTIGSTTPVEQSWRSFRHKITPVREAEKGDKRKILLKYIRMAATWLVFFALGSGLTYYFVRKPADIPSNPVSISVPLGARSNITLPDGSKVWLNAGTTLKYDQNYGQKERRLYLSGEAYFDVAKDKLHPFFVQTPRLMVSALGTKFNIKAYSDEKTISVTLEEGKIDVAMINKNGRREKVRLNPNEKIVYFKEIKESEVYIESDDDKAKQEIRPEKSRSLKLQDANILTNVQTELFTSWKDPRWIIEGEPLGTLAPKLGRRFNLKFVFENTELKKYKFSGTIANETVEQILKAMRLTAPLDYKLNKDTINLLLNRNCKDEYGRIMTRKN